MAEFTGVFKPVVTETVLTVFIIASAVFMLGSIISLSVYRLSRAVSARDQLNDSFKLSAGVPTGSPWDADKLKRVHEIIMQNSTYIHTGRK